MFESSKRHECDGGSEHLALFMSIVAGKFKENARESGIVEALLSEVSDG